MSRQCGQCQLCCTLLPTRELGKGANTRCIHQRYRKGCAIYARRPLPCALWNCRWLVEDDTADVARPDRSGYVLDILPDYITILDHVTGATRPVEVVQIWVDPRRPDAHRDAALRAYLERRAAEGIAGLVRFDSTRALVLIAPALNASGRWAEIVSELREAEHSFTNIAATLGRRPAPIETRT